MISLVEFIRKIWQQPHVIPLTAIIIAAVTVYIVTGKRHEEMFDMLDRQRRIQDETFNKIIGAYEDERKQHEENIKQLQASLVETQKRYDDQIKKLDAKKTQQVETLTKKYDDDPIGMARQIGAITGFTVVGDRQ